MDCEEFHIVYHLLDLLLLSQVKEFDDLIREVESHLPSPENVAADKSNEMSKLSSIGKVVENLGKNYLQKPLLKTDVSNDFKIVHSKMKDNRRTDEKDISKVDNRSSVKEKPAIVKKKVICKLVALLCSVGINCALLN